MKEGPARGAGDDGARLDLARGLLDGFVEETGLEGGVPPRRSLWTDAFATCTELALHERTGSARHLERARTLVDQVHHVLGRHRPDDPRQGWISGLEGTAAELRPTAGGLRIGKPLPERGPDDPPDPRLEWERDGQSFHDLTRWMQALARVAEATGEGRYLEWAVELARVAHGAFVRHAAAPARVVWKMSIDLSRPLVDSMGSHDPLDGLLTFAELREGVRLRDGSAEPTTLDGPIAALQEMCAGGSWATNDPLGIGRLLVDAARAYGLVLRRQLPDTGLPRELLGDAAKSLAAFERAGTLALPRSHRLGFRELGLAIGLTAVERLAAAEAEAAVLGGRGEALLAETLAHAPLRQRIEATWREARAQRGETWTEHLDINRVMLATALVPDGVLGRIPGRMGERFGEAEPG